ncbi:MAG: hypothetical protein MUF64_09865 [Polyangiaceae bacterium]|nr:hypothetical protein [Polyangiaceae bacterium]
MLVSQAGFFLWSLEFIEGGSIQAPRPEVLGVSALVVELAQLHRRFCVLVGPRFDAVKGGEQEQPLEVPLSFSGAILFQHLTHPGQDNLAVFLDVFAGLLL